MLRVDYNSCSVYKKQRTYYIIYLIFSHVFVKNMTYTHFYWKKCSKCELLWLKKGNFDKLGIPQLRQHRHSFYWFVCGSEPAPAVRRDRKKEIRQMYINTYKNRQAIYHTLAHRFRDGLYRSRVEPIFFLIFALLLSTMERWKIASENAVRRDSRIMDRLHWRIVLLCV